MKDNQSQLNKDKFMEEQWARLAAMYGVSVEEVKSKEFDERIEKAFEEKRRRDDAVDKCNRADVWCSIRNGGIVAGIVAGCVWRLMSSRAWWWSIIAGIIFAAVFISAEEEEIKSVKRKNYLDDISQYWEQVNDTLFRFQMNFAFWLVVIFMFLWLATR